MVIMGYGNNFMKFSQQACLTEKSQWSGYAGKKRQFKIKLHKDQSSNMMLGGIKLDDQYRLYCSFENLKLDIVRR